MNNKLRSEASNFMRSRTPLKGQNHVQLCTQKAKSRAIIFRRVNSRELVYM